jgi:two-component system, NtrC family, response regulator AtoC
VVLFSWKLVVLYGSQRISTKQQIEMSVTDGPAAQGFVYGVAPAMLNPNAMATEIAQTDIPVLILGESGTGKDAYARLIHRLSHRGDTHLCKINCSAIDPGDLLAQVHEAMGRFLHQEVSGSIYLDNIQELDVACQRVLLSLLPDGENSLPTDVLCTRFISSTTRNLESEVEAGLFRRELYFRLNGACLHLPPMRDRGEDIPILIEYFLNKHASIQQKKVPAVSPKAMQTLVAYHWPGNIRELENFARKIVVFGDVPMALNDLQTDWIANHEPMKIGPGASLKVAARAASKRAERELIMQALERTRWNRKRAAQDLQISYKSLLYKIKQIGVFKEERGG